MRILVIANLYPSQQDPTFGIFVKHFVDDLREYRPDSIVELCVIKGRTKTIWKKIWNYIVFFSTILYKLLFHEYDLVYNHFVTHSSLPIRLCCRVRNIPLALNFHGEDLIPQTQIQKLLIKTINPLVHYARLVVVPSKFFKNELLARFHNIRSEKVLVSASAGLPEEFFITHKIIDNRTLKIGMVSRIVNGKGWEKFIACIDRLINEGIKVEGYIAGTGDKVDILKESIVNKSYIHYVGSMQHDMLPDFYSSLDLFVFPTEMQESLGLVGLEAMASHTPVIASKIGGIQDYLIDDVNGYFCSPGDVLSLYDSIMKYICLNDKKKKQMGKAAYRTACHYSSDRISSSLNNTLWRIFQK